MMINHTTYNKAGELMAPLPEDLATKYAPEGGRPTVDPGYYHRFKMSSPNAQELLAKKRRFFEMMAKVPGYTTLRLRPYEVRMGNFYRTGLDIVYVVQAA